MYSYKWSWLTVVELSITFPSKSSWDWFHLVKHFISYFPGNCFLFIKYTSLIHFDKHFVRPVCRNVSSICGSFAENLCVRENPVHYHEFGCSSQSISTVLFINNLHDVYWCLLKESFRPKVVPHTHVYGLTPVWVCMCLLKWSAVIYRPQSSHCLYTLERGFEVDRSRSGTKGKNTQFLMLKKSTINHLNTSHNNYVYKICSCFELEVLFQTIQASISKQIPPFLKHPSITPDVSNN